MKAFQKLNNFINADYILWHRLSITFKLIQFSLLICLFVSVMGCKTYKTKIDPEVQKKANLGDEKAQYDIAKSFFETSNEFFITKKSRQNNLEESVVWLEKASNQGNLKAQYHLARYYAIKKKDFDRAFNMMKSLADQGFVEAQYVLSSHYVKGWGTPKDLSQAYKWYLLAFEEDHITLKHFHYYLVFSEYLTHTQISEGQKLAKEHLTLVGPSKHLFETDR
ncbi:tetratricopeptide repeat protein [Gaetbulibacter saemankumensis]|uniref:tetratricopeptide repeat protein n=1 Tax=Gaetbulibacter saemankumensis TaxID=311208 RepID=UPI00041A8C12|nr:tetratricopeptide repeat protein [Gaetbulibacter saemankumensis]